jgi:hypothetical protein
MLFLLGSGFFMYIGAMSIKKNWGNMDLKEKAFLFLPAAAVYLYDVIVLNVIFGTLYFRELPKEKTLSERLDRLAKGNDWSAKEARTICRYLNKYDPSGHHCGVKND